MNHKKNKTVVVIGAGSWGTALAIQLARNNQQIYLWDINTQHIEQLIKYKMNRTHLSDIPFPEGLVPICDIKQIENLPISIIFAVPCYALTDSAKMMSPWEPEQICLACKGLQPKTARFNHEVIGDILPNAAISVLSGPSFATEVALNLITSVVIASKQEQSAEYFAALFHSKTFRCYTHDDIIGVQIAGAAKNIMAIASGICDGLAYGANARAALLTRGLKEIIQIGEKLGAKQTTFVGLSGIGDLILTCTDDKSRNRRFGLALASGTPSKVAQQQIQQTIEGIQVTNEFYYLSKKHHVNMPITEKVFQIIHGQISITEAIDSLLLRKPGRE